MLNLAAVSNLRLNHFRSPLLLLTILSISSWSCDRPKRRDKIEIKRPTARTETPQNQAPDTEAETGLDDGLENEETPEENSPTVSNPPANDSTPPTNTNSDPDPRLTTVASYSGNLLLVSAGTTSESKITIKGADARKLYKNLEIQSRRKSAGNTAYHTIKDAKNLTCERYYEPSDLYTSIYECFTKIDSKTGQTTIIESSPVSDSSDESISSTYNGSNIQLISSNFETAGIIHFAGTDAMTAFSNLEVDPGFERKRKVGKNILCQKNSDSGSEVFACKIYIDFTTGEIREMN